jgi:uncharacterized protein (TIGR02466 family)
MEVVDLFSSFVAKKTLEVNNQEIVDLNRQLIGPNQQFIYDLDNVNPVMNELFDEVQRAFEDVTENVFQLNCKPIIKTAWSNINNARNIVAPHFHPRHSLSAVYYSFATENESELVFMSPVQMIQEKIPQTDVDNTVTQFNRYNSSSFVINSRTGLLVVFPSWLSHFVRYNHGNRMSIAFNADWE